MNNALLMRVINCVGQFLDEIRRPANGNRFVPLQFGQTAAADKVHRVIVLPLMHADFMHGHDARMF